MTFHLIKIVCLILTSAFPFSVVANPLKFGVVPQFDPRITASTWVPIIEAIEARTGIDLELVGVPTIPDFEAAMNSGLFDIAYMNPYHYIVANREQGYLPLVRDGGRSLFGVLTVAVDSPYLTIDDLDGTRIAFPAPNALGASLLMRAELTRLHGINFEPIYVSTHTSAYLNAALAETSAGGGVMRTLSAQSSEIRDRLRIIYETQRVAPHPIAAHPRVPHDTRLLIQQALIELGSTPEGLAMINLIPITKPIIATDADFDILRDLELEAFYVPPE